MSGPESALGLVGLSASASYTLVIMGLRKLRSVREQRRDWLKPGTSRAEIAGFIALIALAMLYLVLRGIGWGT